MATLTRYETEPGRYKTELPNAMQARLKTDKTRVGHINVSRKINPRLLAPRKQNVADATQRNNPDGVYGTNLSKDGREGQIFSYKQNDLAFTWRANETRKSPSLVNSVLEQHGYAFVVFNGIKISAGMTQERFEECFLFDGTASHDYDYGQPGSTVTVSVNGLTTVWNDATDVYQGDPLFWSLPPIKTLERQAERARCDRAAGENGRPRDQLMARISSARPADVALMPRDMIQQWWTKANIADSTESKMVNQPHLSIAALDRQVIKGSALPLDSKQVYVAHMLAFAQWAVYCTMTSLTDGTLKALNNLDLGSVGIADVVGYTGNGGFAGMKTLYARILGVKDEAEKVGQYGKLMHRQASSSLHSGLSIAHSYARNRFAFVAAESAPAFGKVDVIY